MEAEEGGRSSGRGALGLLGPFDGIPYLAWRRLGPLGIDTLFDAAIALGTDQGINNLLEAFPLDEQQNTKFNEALMVFIPKKPRRKETAPPTTTLVTSDRFQSSTRTID